MSLILSISQCPDIYEEQKLPQEFACSSGSIGRDPANTIVLPDSDCLISAQHALIESNGDSYILKDISTNGTFLNDEEHPIGSGRGVLIEEGDRIRIGEYVLAARLDHTVVEQPAAEIEATRKTRLFAGTDDDANFRERFSPSGPQAGSEAEQAQAWQNILSAAGIEAGDADLQELSKELGMTIDAVTRGLMENMKTRTDVKEEFGVPLTRIRPTENNPLKFSVTVEEALENMFIRLGSSYMRGAETYTESLDDFRIHEMATIAAIRAAVDEMVAHFDPKELKKQFQAGDSRKAFLERLQKAEFWDQYEKWFADLTDDEQNFSRVFGQRFAKAYDEKVHRYASMKRGRK
jgi:predicted component of type VI protein secretion system